MSCEPLEESRSPGIPLGGTRRTRRVGRGSPPAAGSRSRIPARNLENAIPSDPLEIPWGTLGDRVYPRGKAFCLLGIASPDISESMKMARQPLVVSRNGKSVTITIAIQIENSEICQMKLMLWRNDKFVKSKILNFFSGGSIQRIVYKIVT